MRCTVLFIGISTLCAALLKAGLDVAIASPQLQTPVWPDKDYPPLVSANRLFEAVHQACPQQGWNEHLLSHTEEGPWNRVADSLTPAENAAIEKAQEQCDAGLSCPADTRFGMEVEMGYLHELVQAICSQRASPDW
ncbi:hypothetical protein [Methyloferula stellata]|uniref:hypothetical protein n=1 Tax=Methyloferula stellata TaxID=876270 RepID=UPI00035F33A1|nr:hypothetical protein [Methyloferula stellata]